MPPKQSPPSQPSNPSSFTPHAPHLGFGSDALPRPAGQAAVHRNEQGHYDVVPPPQNSPNSGRSGHNPYEFIVQPAPKSKASKYMTRGTFIKQMAVMVGGVLLLFIVGGILVNKLEPKGSLPGMLTTAQHQQEIVRIASAATNQATSQDAKNFVTNVEVVVSSGQQQTVAYLTAHKTKTNSKLLALDQSAQTDAILANAATANNYDNAVTQELLSELQTYQNMLRTTYHQTKSTTAQQLLQANFNSADLLIKQGKATQTKLSTPD